ncbi:MAG: hypothetical protein HYX41_02555 [Bdellovibrio sp.]|nr:hypothetical protein [Bdellovibrio sp.]
MVPFYFLASLLWHVVTFLALVLWDQNILKNKATVASRWIDVSVVRSLPENSRVRHHQRSAPSSSVQPTVSLSNLGVPLSGVTKQNHLGSLSDFNGPDLDLSSESGFQAGDALAVATEKSSSIFRYLYERIDQNLSYPNEFVESGFQGPVTARIFLDEEGAWESSTSVIKGAQPYLRVPVVRALRRALMEPVPENIWGKKKERRFIDCLFRFEITQNGDESLLEKRRFVSGRKLFFYRSVYVSKLQWSAGPLSGLGPFSVGFDPTWLVSQAAGLFSKKAKIDPLQKYRDDPAWN